MVEVGSHIIFGKVNLKANKQNLAPEFANDFQTMRKAKS